MDYIIITGPPSYEGRHEFDFTAEYTNKELAWIKQHSGYQPATLPEGLRVGDAELWCILAAIALRRSGKIDVRQVPAVFELLLELPYSSVDVEIADEEQVEDDAGPPPTSSSSNGATSGAVSEPSSESQESRPSPTGIPESATSAFAPPRSGS